MAAVSSLLPSSTRIRTSTMSGSSATVNASVRAALVDGVCCAAAYALLRLCGGTAVESLAFGAMSAFFFYPPTGTPFMDQHSFFFMLLMFLAVAFGTVRSGRQETIAWATVPALF